jgi:nucleotide-binding universal stress UspA family protein
MERCLAYTTLLACLRIDRPNADLLAVVSDTAQRFGSTVIGVLTKQASAHVHARVMGPAEPPEHDLQAFMERASVIEMEFRSALSDIDRLDWRPHLIVGPAFEHVANEARGADLVIASIDRRNGLLAPSGQADVGDLLMHLGRPLLAVPPGAPGLALDEVLVCWKDSRETRRAVADALPMLQASQSVDIIEIVEAGGLEDARRRLGDVGEWLMRHGVESNCAAEVANGDAGRQLAGVAKDLRADLIVAGAFGHNRLREWAFGGVTTELLLHADRCVLASH